MCVRLFELRFNKFVVVTLECIPLRIAKPSTFIITHVNKVEALPATLCHISRHFPSAIITKVCQNFETYLRKDRSGVGVAQLRGR